MNIIIGIVIYLLGAVLIGKLLKRNVQHYPKVEDTDNG